MNRLRPALNAILGLLLLVQGTAVAWANGSIDAAAEASASAQMPCHGDQDAGSDQRASCCDSDCPNMTTCVLGHLAVASAPALALARAVQRYLPASVQSPGAAAPPSLLRPPIFLHA